MPTTNRLSNLRGNFRNGAAISRQIEHEQEETLKEIEQVQKQSGQTTPKPGVNATINVFNLKDNPFQYLQRDEAEETVDDEEFQALVNSIRDYGFQGGIIITRFDNDYYIVQGHRRAKAIRYLATTEDFEPTIQVILVELTKDQMIGFLVTSNSTSRPVSPLKTALTVSYYQNQQGLSVRDIVKVTGMSKKKIENYLVLNKMPVEVKEQVEKGKLSLNQVLDLHSQNTFNTKAEPNPTKTKGDKLESLQDYGQNDVPQQEKINVEPIKEALELHKALNGAWKSLNKAVTQLNDVQEGIDETWSEKLLQVVKDLELKILGLTIK